MFSVTTLVDFVVLLFLQVIAALAVVASAAPGNYAAHRSVALPIGLGAIAAPAAELKTIKVDEIKTVPVTAAHTYAAPAYGYGYAAPAYGYGYAPAAVAVKSVAPAEVKTIKVDEIKAAPVALGYSGYAGYGYGYAPAAVAVKSVAPAEVKTVKVEEVKPVAVAAPVTYAAPAVAYSAPTVVRQEVEVPVVKTVHYADQQVVTGHTTNIIKPAIAAPAIAAPRTLIGKTITNPATVSVQKYAAEVKTLNPVAQPYDVHYDVPEPYAVPTPVHTAPVEVRKRVYAPAAYAAPVAAPAPVAYAAPAAVAVKAVPVEAKVW